jgi:alkylhydroperoxidase/carboxymuconolactone decarboxylase family protein YurZ
MGIASAAFGRLRSELAAMADGPLVRGIDRAESGHMIGSAGAMQSCATAWSPAPVASRQPR